MDLSMHEKAVDYLYRHKKFDHGKRPREEDVLQELNQLNRDGRSPANAILLNPHFYGVERVSTPFSTDSNCSSEYTGFVTRCNATSTPSSKRPRLISSGACGTSNPSSEDSGVVTLTPKKVVTVNESQPGQQRKRLLKPSLLAQPPMKKQKAVQAGAAKQTYTTSKNPGNNSNSGDNSATNPITGSSAINVSTNTSAINTSANKGIKTYLSNKSVSPVSANSIKAVLKPTEVGTLELPKGADSLVNNSDPQLDANSVLSRISEDKLRSICTFHTNMVRQFPKKERSPKDQERRNKNTIACRMSRRIKKLEQIAVEEECKELEQRHEAMTEEILRATAYLEQLELLMAQTQISDDEDSEIDVVNVGDENDTPATASASKLNNKPVGVPMQPPLVTRPASSIKPHPFSIAGLLGNLSPINA
ncbi:PREDICTED: rho GTPase-activating protein gacU [Bactrocera latifrons]|uniref:BZIP domain-containing protein n=1 Tax=Bactrocera latifrons TaxID=174628 RepID=A0A0K8VP42_BACLA|nr:PREDICTED: rho GTPase-activating protein gacU [Bactrocera latifrons]